MLSDAMNDLQEQVKVEHVPAEKNDAGQAVSLYARFVTAETEHRVVAPGRNLLALRLPIHQVY
jgi:hypothetical protein